MLRSIMRILRRITRSSNILRLRRPAGEADTSSNTQPTLPRPAHTAMLSISLPKACTIVPCLHSSSRIHCSSSNMFLLARAMARGRGTSPPRIRTSSSSTRIPTRPSGFPTMVAAAAAAAALLLLLVHMHMRMHMRRLPIPAATAAAVTAPVAVVVVAAEEAVGP